jgi:hypothetical protein
MSETRFDNLPEVLKSLRTRPLFVMHLKVRPLVVVGATPGVNRRIGLVPGIASVFSVKIFSAARNLGH